MRSGLKPWPRDAVMVVAARARDARPELMEGVAVEQCRDCRAVLHADTFTVRTAWGMPQRVGRPVLFFCPACCAGYDRSTVGVTVDHSGGRSAALRGAPPVPTAADEADSN